MPFPCRTHALPLPCRAAKDLECVFPIWYYTVRPYLIHACHAMLRPCRSSQGNSTARPALDGRAVSWPWEERHGMASVNQTRPHCVNQTEKTHSKPVAARHGRGAACYVWIGLYYGTAMSLPSTSFPVLIHWLTYHWRLQDMNYWRCRSIT